MVREWRVRDPELKKLCLQVQNIQTENVVSLEHVARLVNLISLHAQHMHHAAVICAVETNVKMQHYWLQQLLLVLDGLAVRLNR